MAATIVFYAQFVASKAGKGGLSPTVDVERITRADGTRSALVTGGSASAVGRRGLYYYVLANADLLTYDYLATFITADATVDQQEIPALWVEWAIPHTAELANLDATVSSRLATTGYTAPPSASSIASAVWSAVVRTITGGGGSASDIWSYSSRTLTQPAAAVVAAVQGASIALVRGDSLSISLTGLPSNTGYVAIDFTVKASPDDPDSAALLRIRKTAAGVGDGLLTLNGAAPVAPVVAADGAIVVDSATAITITLAARASALLVPQDGLAYDVQYIFAASVVQTASQGAATITADVTQAVA